MGDVIWCPACERYHPLAGDDKHRRGYRVAWSEEDGEYVATTDGMASLSYLAPDAVDALAGLIRLMTWDEDHG